MQYSIVTTVLAAVSTLFLANTVAGGSGLTAAEYQGCYSSSYPLSTNSSLTYEYQSSGWCQDQCGEYLAKAVFGLKNGNECWCGDELPANDTKVSDSECNSPCDGYGTQDCGGSSVWSVYTSGLTDDVDSVSGAAASSAAAASDSSTASSTTSSATHESTQEQTTVTQAGKTVVITAGSSATASSSSSSSGGGTSKAGIAAGVVVGIVALGACAGGAFFFVRHRKRKAIEEEHRREQAISSFGKSGTIKSESSAADSRLDPTVMYRRQSDGSIADEMDFTRRVLKVTNPDRAA